MIKILFMVINMNIGGTEKSLLNIINELSKDKYEVTILMLEKYGGFLDSIPKHVKVEYLEGYNEIKDDLNQQPRILCKKYIKNKQFIKVISLIWWHILSKIIGDRRCYFRYVSRKLEIKKEKYDIAVAFAGPMDFISYYIINKVNSSFKFQWIHFDINKIIFNKKFAERLYKKFDKIIVVSEEAKDKLISKIPILEDRTRVFHNIISENTIKTMSKNGQGFEDDYNGIRILTVGRVSKEKGQDLSIEALKKLKKDGYNVRWYCIGDGKYRRDCEEIVEKYNLKDDYIFLGSKINPYPYMKECDVYVQPSRYEGYCITTLEAKLMYRPIVVTEVNGMREQIFNNVNGLIVSINSESIYNGVKKLIDNTALRNKFIKQLEKEKILRSNELNKLFSCNLL